MDDRQFGGVHRRRRIFSGLARGVEDLPLGAVAEEILARRAENPKEIERAIEL